jgi:ParB family chromosome partitioning protein
MSKTDATPAERLKRIGEVFLIPVDKIVIDEQINNGRIDFGDLEELANSIEESGLRIPLLVKRTKVDGEEKFILMQGKRRLKAIELLIARGVDFPGIKCLTVSPTYSVENSLFDQIVMNDGKPYSSVEQGIVFAQLIERGYDAKEISRKVGKSVSHILNCVEVASLPKRVRDLVASGSLSGLTAVELSKVVTNEDELVAKLEAAIAEAPVNAVGEKKKVTNKNVKQIASASPMKKLAEVRLALREEGIENERTELLRVLVSRLKAGESVESIAELFK